MSYSRKKGESCPSHTKKCVTIEFERRKVSAQHKIGEKAHQFAQFAPKSTHQASFLPNHIPDITTVKHEEVSYKHAATSDASRDFLVEKSSRNLQQASLEKSLPFPDTSLE